MEELSSSEKKKTLVKVGFFIFLFTIFTGNIAVGLTAALVYICSIMFSDYDQKKEND